MLFQISSVKGLPQIHDKHRRNAHNAITDTSHERFCVYGNQDLVSEGF
jgi:hypothetical protein